MYALEKKEELSRDEKRIEMSRGTLIDYGLHDVGYFGPWYTWERGNLPETNIRERLDQGWQMKKLWELNNGDVFLRLEGLRVGLSRWLGVFWKK